jgi:hypothetical protein
MTRTSRSTNAAAVALAALMTMMSQRAVVAATDRAALKAPEPLRASDRTLIELIDQGLARSPTLRAMQEHLQQAQVIVYITWGATMPAETVGRTRLIGAGGGYRYLSIELDSRLGHLEVLSMLGHELQHAVEIADAVDVVDQATLASLYRRIGQDRSRPSSGGLWFETQQAINVGHRVYAELLGYW